MASPLFDINDDGNDRGYEAGTSEELTLKLRFPIGVTKVVFQVFDPDGFDPDLGIAGNPPRASKGAEEIDLEVPGTLAKSVSPLTVEGSVTIDMPATTGHSWIVRCVINDGKKTLPNGEAVTDPSLIHERGIFIRTTSGGRKVVCTELQQFEVDGWAGALSEFMDTVVDLTPVSRPLSRRLLLQDHFLTGGDADGTIGQLGWRKIVSGAGTIARDFGFVGRYRFETGAVANDHAFIQFAGTFAPNQVDVQQWIVNPAKDGTAGKKLFFGWTSDPTQLEVASDAYGFFYDGTTWKTLDRSGGSGAPSDTGQGGADTLETLTMLKAAGRYFFYVDQTLVGQDVSIPATDMLVAGGVQTTEAAVKVTEVFYFGLGANPINFALYQNDGMLLGS